MRPNIQSSGVWSEGPLYDLGELPIVELIEFEERRSWSWPERAIHSPGNRVKPRVSKLHNEHLPLIIAAYDRFSLSRMANARSQKM